MSFSGKSSSRSKAHLKTSHSEIPWGRGRVLDRQAVLLYACRSSRTARAELPHVFVFGRPAVQFLLHSPTLVRSFQCTWPVYDRVFG